MRDQFEVVLKTGTVFKCQRLGADRWRVTATWPSSVYVPAQRHEPGRPPFLKDVCEANDRAIIAIFGDRKEAA